MPDRSRIRGAIKDVLAGLAFVGFGLAFAVGASRYEIGTALSMGPGYFPLVMGGVLVLRGILIIAKGFVAGEGGAIGSIPWKAASLILAALLFFGATIRGLGVVPSVFVTALLAGFSGHRPGLVAPVVIAAGITVVSVLVFVVALQLRLPLFGPWIPV
jgi:putative tricarboxylic transport membrane protein